jgi:hypothetical protein
MEAQGDRAGALRALAHWIRAAPDAELRRQMADMLIRDGRAEEGGRLLAELVQEGAAPPEALLRLGRAMAEQGAPELAEGMFSDSFHGTDVPALKRAAWRHYAAMAEAAGRHETALDRWKLLASFTPLETDDWRHIGTLAARLGDVETVATALAQLADPDDRDALRQLLAEGRQDWADAGRAASDRLARALPTDVAELCRTRIRYALRAGDDREAVRAMFSFRRRDPEAVGGEPTAVMQAASAFRRLGKPRGAEALLRAHMASRDAVDPRLDLLFAELLLAQGRRAEAASALDGVEIGDPALAARQERLRGHLAFAAGDRAAAARHFRAANTGGWPTESSSLREVQAWEALADRGQRSLALRRGLGAFPESTSLSREAARFAEEEGDWRSAAAAWAHCAARQPGDRAVSCRQALALLEGGRPYHFLSLADRLVDAAEAERSAAFGQAGSPFHEALVGSYRRLLREPSAAYGRDLHALADLARTHAERAALARFEARAARGAAAARDVAPLAATPAPGSAATVAG